jgi:RimJ/RimL family protein N-acetyltransferase
MNRKNEIVLETDRLILREISKNDKKNLAEILQSPDVPSHYHEIFNDGDLYRFMIDNALQYEKNKIGIFAVIKKLDLKFIGIIGIKKVRFEDYSEIYELSFALKRGYQQKGYAFEGVSFCLKYVKLKLGIIEVFACIHSENVKAIKLIKRLNFSYVSQYIENGKIYIWYKISLK